MEQLNVLLRIFFVSGVFKKFDFWPLLKAETVLPPKQFRQGKKILQILFPIIHMVLYFQVKPEGPDGQRRPSIVSRNIKKIFGKS